MLLHNDGRRNTLLMILLLTPSFLSSSQMSVLGAWKTKSPCSICISGSLVGTVGFDEEATVGSDAARANIPLPGGGRAIRFSDDGRRLAILGQHILVCVETRYFKVTDRWKLPPDWNPIPLAVSHDGTLIAAGSDTGLFNLYRPGKKKPVLQVDLRRKLHGMTQITMEGLAISKNGRFVAVSGNSYIIQEDLWTRKFTTLWRASARGEYASALAYSASGELAGAMDDGTTLLFRRDSRSPRKLQGRIGYCIGLDFAGSSSSLVRLNQAIKRRMNSGPDQLTIYDTERGNQIKALKLRILPEGLGVDALHPSQIVILFSDGKFERLSF